MGTAQPRAENRLCTVVSQMVDCLESCLNTQVIKHATIVQRDIEVHAGENCLASHGNIANRAKWHP